MAEPERLGSARDGSATRSSFRDPTEGAVGVDEARPIDRADAGHVASTVSRRIVQLHARLYGRGPTRARTYLQDDYVLTVLEEIFTPAERTLISADRSDHVFASRRAFQEIAAAEFQEIVEEATGRRVRAFMSQVHVGTEVAAELFLLEPNSRP